MPINVTLSSTEVYTPNDDLSVEFSLNQTVEGRYNPWQGWNILGQSIPENKEQSINTLDKDKRPSLGLWYYEELIGNKQKDWYSLHSDSYKNLEGNFTGSFNTKYNSKCQLFFSDNL